MHRKMIILDSLVPSIPHKLSMIDPFVLKMLMMESYTDQSAYSLDNQNSVQQGLPSSDVSPLQGKVKPFKIRSSLALS